MKKDGEIGSVNLDEASAALEGLVNPEGKTSELGDAGNLPSDSSERKKAQDAEDKQSQEELKKKLAEGIKKRQQSAQLGKGASGSYNPKLG